MNNNVISGINDTSATENELQHALLEEDSSKWAQTITNAINLSNSISTLQKHQVWLIYKDI